MRIEFGFIRRSCYKLIIQSVCGSVTSRPCRVCCGMSVYDGVVVGNIIRATDTPTSDSYSQSHVSSLKSRHLFKSSFSIYDEFRPHLKKRQTVYII